MSGTSNESHGAVAGSLFQFGPVQGSVYIGARGAKPAIQVLPEVTTFFRNRREEFATLDRCAEEAKESPQARLCFITGPPGSGRTTLAVSWMLANADRFPHAKIAVDCGGGAGERQGRAIPEICRLFLNWRGVDTDELDLGTEAASLRAFAAYLAADGPAVILLDDVRSAAQIRPLLSVRGLLVIATLPQPLPGFAQHRPRKIPLRPMADGDIHGLIAEIVADGDREDVEAAAVATLVGLCGGSPLIASHAACLLADRPEIPAGTLVERMAEQGRLAALEAGTETGAPRPADVFNVTYVELGAGAASLYRALGLHPVPDFDSWLAASLTPTAEAGGTAEALRELRNRGLVRLGARGRYQMDGPTYEHAQLMAERDCTPEERSRIEERIAGYYLYGAFAADNFHSQRWRLSPMYWAPSPYPLPDFAAARDRSPDRVSGRHRAPDDPPTAEEWTGDSLEAILACMRRSARLWTGSPAPGYCKDMAEATNGYFTRSGRSDERATILELGRADAEACGDADALARIHAQWGEELLGQDRVEAAEEHLRRSLTAAMEGSEPRGQGAALEWLGIAERRRERYPEARAYFEWSLPLLDQARLRPFALHHMHMGDTYAGEDNRDRALGHYAESLELFRRHAAEEARDHANEGKVLMRQGVLLAADRPREAATLLEEAAQRFGAAGRRYQQGKALEALGDLGGDTEAARRHWSDALALYREARRNAAAERVQAKLDA